MMCKKSTFYIFAFYYLFFAFEILRKQIIFIVCNTSVAFGRLIHFCNIQINNTQNLHTQVGTNCRKILL